MLAGSCCHTPHTSQDGEEESPALPRSWGEYCAECTLRVKADAPGWHPELAKLISSSACKLRLPCVILTAFRKDSVAFKAGDETGMMQETRMVRAGETGSKGVPGFPSRAGNRRGISVCSWRIPLTRLPPVQTPLIIPRFPPCSLHTLLDHLELPQTRHETAEKGITETLKQQRSFCQPELPAQLHDIHIFLGNHNSLGVC